MATATETGTGRARVGMVAQTLRLTRTEFVLFYRYRTALYFGMLPVLLLALTTVQDGDEIFPGVDLGAYLSVGILAVGPMMVALLHVSNVYAARREQFILKRFRVSGVRPAVLFGATTLSMLGVTAVVAVLTGALLAGRYDTLPVAAPLVLLSVLLVAVTTCLLAIAFTRLARNNEGAQMLVMLPFLLLLGSSGYAFPLEMMPEAAQTASRLLPMAPAVDVAVLGYLGVDLTTAGAPAVSGAELWRAAVPGLAVQGVWLGLAVFLLRYFRWDPREAK